jgi:hypothetical protein
MHSPKQILTPLIAVSLLCLAPAVSWSQGLHLGWCNGVGNQHQAANCGGSSTGVPSGSTPNTVPTANQLPGGGVQQPTPAGMPATVVITPNPPQVITGTSPVPTIQGQPGPTITGTSPQPIYIQPLPQTVFTGTSPVPPLQTLPTPSITGGTPPTITITPTAPQTLTGTSPVPALQTLPTPSFTGQGLPTIIVVPNPQTTITGFGPVPPTIIIPAGQKLTFGGYGAVPYPKPVATPMQVPNRVPQATPQATPMIVPRPRPLAVPYQVPNQVPQARPQARPVLVPKQQAAAVGHGHVTNTTGRQPAHATPRFRAADGGTDWHCLASGHGKRRSYVDGQVAVSGALRHVGAVDVLGRDLPALHPQHTSCVISVRRRGDG